MISFKLLDKHFHCIETYHSPTSKPSEVTDTFLDFEAIQQEDMRSGEKRRKFDSNSKNVRRRLRRFICQQFKNKCYSLKLKAFPFTCIITIGISTRTIILTMWANMPAPSRIIFNDKPRSISKHNMIGTMESENGLYRIVYAKINWV